MKSNTSILLLTFILLFAACRNETTERNIISQAKSLCKSDPDSSYALLNTIELPDILSDKLLARWCMLYGQVADTLQEEMPYTSQLTRALSYYKKHGTQKEQARIGLYLGRSYVEDKEYEKAMKAYISALETALQAKDYNQAGYICSYMGDLYDMGDINLQAVEKYLEAGNYFNRAGNKRSYAFTLRDVARCYCLIDSLNTALSYLQKADTIITSLGKVEDISYIYNGLGNVYNMLDSLDLAEKYQLMAIHLDSTDNGPNYLALSEIYRKKGDISLARHYLQKSSITYTKNENTSVAALHDSYLIEKASGNVTASLSYLEQYTLVSDSVLVMQNEMEIIDAEKKYNHQKVLIENMRLNANKQYMITTVVVLITICLMLVVIYQTIVKRKNSKIVRQNDALTQKDIHLLKLSLDLKERKSELEQLSDKLIKSAELLDRQESYREQMAMYEAKKEEMIQLHDQLIQLKKEKLELSMIAKKLRKLSEKVIPGAASALLSDRDWKLIQETIDDIYFPLSRKLMNNDIHLTSTELHYCYLAFFDLEVNAVAILLNITPDSVGKAYQRLRQKLGVTGGKAELYDCLINLQ